MALRGTLKDFGIADIFQLIGHQGKSGTLLVRNREHQVVISFSKGNVVRAQSSTREKRDLLGAILVRAEIVTDEQLKECLGLQKSLNKRLGATLIHQGYIDEETLGAMTRLQTTETIYRLFLWDYGTYEFTSGEVPESERDELIRSENVLMEGFRQVDEWPMIRKRLVGYGMAFSKLEDLDELLAEAGAHSGGGGDDELGGLDDAFAEFELGDSGGGNARLKNISDNERLVYGLVTPERDFQKIIDLSRLGEFEACKAMVNLIDAEIVEVVPEGATKKPSQPATVGGITQTQHHSWLRVAMRVGLVVAGLVGALAGVSQLGIEPHKVFSHHERTGFVPTGLQRMLGAGRLLTIDRAVRVFHAQHGQYPATLDELVAAGLIEETDISFPWDERPFYERSEDGYALLRPLR